jgi:hypothetical protein
VYSGPAPRRGHRLNTDPLNDLGLSLGHRFQTVLTSVSCVEQVAQKRVVRLAERSPSYCPVIPSPRFDLRRIATRTASAVTSIMRPRRPRHHNQCCTRSSIPKATNRGRSSHQARARKPETPAGVGRSGDRLAYAARHGLCRRRASGGQRYATAGATSSSRRLDVHPFTPLPPGRTLHIERQSLCLHFSRERASQRITIRAAAANAMRR